MNRRSSPESLPSRSRAALSRAALLGCLLCLLGASGAEAAPAWLAPVDLSTPGRDATNARVAMDAAGETVAVWERQSETETNHVVQASVRAPGAGFSAAIELAPASSEPQVAMTPSGEAVALWRHFDVNSGDYVIQASTRPPRGSFSAPVDVAETANQALPQDLQLAANAAGDAAVAWTQQEPGSGLSPNPTLVEASVRPTGGSFSTPVVLSPLPLVAGQSAQSPRIAIDAAGEARAVWRYDDGTDQVIQSASRPASGSFSAPEELTADGEDGFEANIAVDAAGAATVVWDRLKGGDFTVRASASPPGGPFATPVDLSSADSVPSSQPAVAMSATGATTAAWTHFDGTHNIVQASTGSPGGFFSAPIDLSAAAQEALYPEVAAGTAGRATVVWKGSDATNAIVEASTGSAGVFQAPVNLSAGGQDALFPTVAMDAAGDATAVWWRSDGTHTIVQAAGYDADPPELGNLSVPPSGTVGVPLSFSVSSFDVWPIAATSFGFGDGAVAGGASVSHTYEAPGTYRVTVDSKDAAGTAASASAPIAILPSNDFRIRKVRLNKKKGRGSAILTVPGPGKLVLSGRGVRRASKRAERAGTVKLAIKARGKAAKRLSTRGRARVMLRIAFTPDGGNRLVREKTVTLIEKRPSKRRRSSQHD